MLTHIAARARRRRGPRWEGGEGCSQKSSGDRSSLSRRRSKSKSESRSGALQHGPSNRRSLAAASTGLPMGDPDDAGPDTALWGQPSAAVRHTAVYEGKAGGRGGGARRGMIAASDKARVMAAHACAAAEAASTWPRSAAMVAAWAAAAAAAAPRTEEREGRPARTPSSMGEGGSHRPTGRRRDAGARVGEHRA